jgi:arsenate reductase-like glutaredoxin family protein
MDKAQKQLVDTYFRKREIAAGESGYGYPDSGEGIKSHELFYMIKNNKLNPQKINSGSFGNQIAALINKDPRLYQDKDVQPYLNHLNIYNKANILSNHPEFINKPEFGDIINDLKGDSIEVILEKQPELLNRFDLNKLNVSNIINILAEQPHLVEMPIFEKALRTYVKNGDRFDFWRKIDGSSYLSWRNKERGEVLYANQQRKFVNAIVKYPIYRELFAHELKRISNYGEMIDLLRADKTLLPYFDLSKPKDYTLRNLLVLLPEVIDKISKEQIDTLDTYDIKQIQQYHPDLRKYFEHILNPIPVKNYGSIRKQIENDDRFANLRQYLSPISDDVTPTGLRALRHKFSENQKQVRNNEEYDAYEKQIKSIDILLQMFDK